nr:MAG TPA: tail tube protein [Caudoviricetes sp.]
MIYHRRINRATASKFSKIVINMQSFLQIIYHSITTEVVSVKHILVVTPKKLNPGKVATAAAAEVSGEYAVSYYATYIDGKKKLEIDPLNDIYYVNGKDYLADVRKALGK